jgi:hypothetical protein
MQATINTLVQRASHNSCNSLVVRIASTHTHRLQQSGGPHCIYAYASTTAVWWSALHLRIRTDSQQSMALQTTHHVAIQQHRVSLSFGILYCHFERSCFTKRLPIINATSLNRYRSPVLVQYKTRPIDVNLPQRRMNTLAASESNHHCSMNKPSRPLSHA